MIRIKTQIPGPKSFRILKTLKIKNGGWAVPYPLVHSGNGEGPYCEDIDGNIFLDFASQIAANPLGYNHPELIEVIRSYANRFPIKYAGQDFSISEHLELIENLTGISPSSFDRAFLINSGAEAVENAIKICMRKRPATKVGISMKRGWHGRTLGALSLTNSKKVHTKGYMRLNMMRLPYDESAAEELMRIITEEVSSEEVGFVILEHVQGEGGYNIASKKMISDLRKVTKENNIPYISDEVQTGMGRTGKWWAFEHYGIVPDIFSSAKALQVGAVVSRKNMFPNDPGAISSTWGGGHMIDLALGIKTIDIIKKEKLLDSNTRTGTYMLKRLKEIKGIENQRGLGLMLAFDLCDSETRDSFIIECAKNGLLILGCGIRGVRLIPPYIIQREDIDKGFDIINKAVKLCNVKKNLHTGQIRTFIECGKSVT